MAKNHYGGHLGLGEGPIGLREDLNGLWEVAPVLLGGRVSLGMRARAHRDIEF